MKNFLLIDHTIRIFPHKYKMGGDLPRLIKVNFYNDSLRKYTIKNNSSANGKLEKQLRNYLKECRIFTW